MRHGIISQKEARSATYCVVPAIGPGHFLLGSKDQLEDPILTGCAGDMLQLWGQVWRGKLTAHKRRASLPRVNEVSVCVCVCVCPPQWMCLCVYVSLCALFKRECLSLRIYLFVSAYFCVCLGIEHFIIYVSVCAMHVCVCVQCVYTYQWVHACADCR
jgi:hypothetical protein